MSEFGKCFVTNDGGVSWIAGAIPVSMACPSVGGGNLELWSLALDDPADAESGGWMAGGVGNNIGYIFRTTGIWDDTTGYWDPDSWTQSYCYQSLAPSQLLLEDNCSISTVYAGVSLGTGDPIALMAGYAGSILVMQEPDSGTANFDPCECEAFVSPSTCSSTGPLWVQKDYETEEVETQCNLRTPFYAAAGKGADSACVVGAFGRIVTYDYIDHPSATEYELVDRANVTFMRIAAGDFISQTEGCITGQFQQIWRTTDGAATWANVSPVSCNGNEVGTDLVYSSSGDKALAVGTSGFIAYSHDGGETWTEVSNNDTTDWSAVSFGENENIAYVVGAGGKIRKTTNGGIVWRDLSDLGNLTLTGVSFLDDEIGYVVGEYKRVYFTTEAGGSWSQIPVNTTGQETLLDVMTWGDGSTAVVVGQNGLVLEREATGFEPVDASSFTALGLTVELGDVQVLLNGSHVDLRIGGHEGTVLFRDAGVWTQPRSYTNNPIHQVVFQDSDHGFALGQNFVVLEYTD